MRVRGKKMQSDEVYYEKVARYALEYLGIKFHYNTAKELGWLVNKSGSTMSNPFAPDNTDYDDYIEGYLEGYNGDGLR